MNVNNQFKLPQEVWKELSQEQRTTFNETFPQVKEQRQTIIAALPQDERSFYDNRTTDVFLQLVVAATIRAQQLVTH